MNDEKKEEGTVTEEGQRRRSSQEEVNTVHLAAEAAGGRLGSLMGRHGERSAGLCRESQVC